MTLVDATDIAVMLRRCGDPEIDTARARHLLYRWGVKAIVPRGPGRPVALYDLEQVAAVIHERTRRGLSCHITPRQTRRTA